MRRGYADVDVVCEVEESLEQQVRVLVVVGGVEGIDHVPEQVQRVDIVDHLGVGREVLEDLGREYAQLGVLCMQRLEDALEHVSRTELGDERTTF